MSIERKSLKLALEALENIVSAVDTPYRLLKPYHSEIDSVRKLIPAIKEALSSPNGEARTWVGLTDEERKDLCRWWSSPMDAIYATETLLKKKNTHEHK